jgi:N utilization substance protein A
MSNEIFQAIEQVGREKGIEVDIIVQAVEDAYAAAAKKYFRTKEDLGARFDRESGMLEVFARKRIMEEVTDPDLEITDEDARTLALAATEEGIVEIPKPQDELQQLGRIAAQAAKQIIFQKVREAERDNIYKEYVDRVGEMINGVVKRFERGNIIIDLGRTEAVLPKKEQSKAERYSQGDRIRAVIVDVDHNAKGPQVIISRTDEHLLSKLFEMEVPEIYDGTVIIERAVRDPGDRAKVAVRSKDRDVDPVGACVGMKGSRVQSIIRELRGEKIDIVQYSDDVSSFVTNSLNPAKINRVHLADPENKTLEVVVDDEQLSLAIGKKGQNVRLASRLSGWKIDIKSEQDKKREVEAEMERIARDSREVEALEGIGPKNIENILAAGYRSIEEIIAAGVDGLSAVSGIGPKTAEKIAASAQAMLDTRPEREEEERLAREQVEAEEAAARQAAEEQAAAEEEAARLAEEALQAEQLPGDEEAPEGEAAAPEAAPESEAEWSEAALESGATEELATDSGVLEEKYADPAQSAEESADASVQTAEAEPAGETPPEQATSPAEMEQPAPEPGTDESDPEDRREES